MIISYDYELCLIGLIILWIRHCNCTAACGRLCRLVVHFDNSSSCLKFAFTQTFVKEALCNDITCRSAIYLKFHGLFPNNQLCKQLSCVLLVCYSIRLQLGHQFDRAHLGHHNRFQRRCTLHVLSKLTNTLLLWPWQTDRCELTYFVVVGTRFAIRRTVSRFVTIPAVFVRFVPKVCGCLPVEFDPLLLLL